MDLRRLLGWAPFKIDARGLVTILGADEVNRSIGRLSKSRVTEYLPLVSSFVVANDGIRSVIPGFELYNISDGICATDFAGWFSRWLLSQDLTYNCTTLTMDTRQPMRPSKDSPVLAASVGITVGCTVIMMPALTADWWGLANAISMEVCVLIRSMIINANREAVKQSVREEMQQSSKVVKVLCKVTNGCSVTIYAPRGIVTQCLLSQTRESDPRLYFMYRMVGWVAFFVHIVTLGMAALPNQLLSVSVLAASTVCVALCVGSNEESIGDELVIRRLDYRGPDKSMAACFARLGLSEDEENGMLAWKLIPQARNKVWWRKYQACLAQNNMRAFNDWSDKRTWLLYENLLSAEDHQGTAQRTDTAAR